MEGSICVMLNTGIIPDASVADVVSALPPVLSIPVISVPCTVLNVTAVSDAVVVSGLLLRIVSSDTALCESVRLLIHMPDGSEPLPSPERVITPSLSQYLNARRISFSVWLKVSARPAMEISVADLPERYKR